MAIVNCAQFYISRIVQFIQNVSCILFHSLYNEGVTDRDKRRQEEAAGPGVPGKGGNNEDS